jgi:hypothetical protein
MKLLLNHETDVGSVSRRPELYTKRGQYVIRPERYTKGLIDSHHHHIITHTLTGHDAMTEYM